MSEDKIQCLNPQPGKTGKNIRKVKYDQIKLELLKILKNTQPTHTELFEQLVKQLSGKFDGNISWYGECVKLDLEARGIIRRDENKPSKYHIA